MDSNKNHSIDLQSDMDKIHSLCLDRELHFHLRIFHNDFEINGECSGE